MRRLNTNMTIPFSQTFFFIQFFSLTPFLFSLTRKQKPVLFFYVCISSFVNLLLSILWQQVVRLPYCMQVLQLLLGKTLNYLPYMDYWQLFLHIFKPSKSTQRVEVTFLNLLKQIT